MVDTANIERKIVEWLLAINGRFSEHFYHWVALLWRPTSVVDMAQGERAGTVFLIRSGAFSKEGDLSRYLHRYATFLNLSRTASFADYIFRERGRKPICTIGRGSNWRVEESIFNAVTGTEHISIQIPCESHRNDCRCKIKINTELHQEIFGTPNYPFSPASPLIGSWNSGHSDVPIAVDLAQYPTCNDFRELDQSDFDQFKRAFSQHLPVSQTDHKQGDLKECQCTMCRVYRGLKLLCIIPEWNSILFVPVPVMRTKQGEEITFLGVVVFSRLEPKAVRQRDIGELDEIVASVLGTGYALSFHEAVDLATRQVRLYVLRSAIAAIMARNMSHNIESHVTPRATVEAVRKRLEDLGSSNSLDIVRVIKDRLDLYRQKRADFLAEVTSEPLTTTRPAFFYRELILPLIENTLLMDNIARNEGICYRNNTDNRLRIRVLIRNKELKVTYGCSKSTTPCSQTFIYPCTYPYTSVCCCGEPVKLKSIENGDSDVEIELPGPVGEQAFYAFLENFIRNAAKHNRDRFDKNPCENLEVTIEIKEPEDDKEKAEYYIIEVWDNVTNPEGVFEKIQEYIASDVIEETTGELKRQAWGIAEMKVAATLLRGSTDFLQMREFLKVKKEKRQATESQERLIYEFRLMKAKRMIGVFPRWQGGENQLQSLRNAGIRIVSSVEELQKIVASTGAEGASRSAASFRFAVFDCSGSDGQAIAEKIEPLLPYLPFRVLVLTGKNTESNLPLPNGVHRVQEERTEFPTQPDQIMVWLWKHWLGRWGQKNIVLEVYLDQQCGESPTKEWAECANTINKSNQGKGLFCRVWGREEGKCSQEVQFDANAVHIFFDRHAGGVEKAEKAGFGGDFLGCHAYMLLDKLNADFVRVFQPVFPGDASHWTLPFELMESGLLRILVIDERIAEACLEPGDMEITKEGQRLGCKPTQGSVGPTPTLWHLAFGAKVYIATHFGFNKDPEPLHSTSYAKREEVALPYLAVRITKNGDCINFQYPCCCICEETKELPKIDMVIIHQGVLDEWVKDVEPKAFLEMLRKKIPFVVVESGRGIPPNLPEGVKFLPFSFLHDLVIARKRVAKYSLTLGVMSLTRRQKEGDQ